LKSINSRILSFAVLATLIPSAGLGTLSFWRYQVVISDNVNHELRMMASDASGELTAWSRERISEIRAFSTAYTVIDGLTAEMTPRSGSARVGAHELELYLRSVQGKLEPIRELTLSDASGRMVASSASRPAPVVLPTTWSSAAITEGVILEPPRWDDVRATATVTVVVPVLSQHNELLGALSAVLDLGNAIPRLQYIVRTTPAELILLAPDGTPLLGTQTAATALAPLGLQSLDRLRAVQGEPMTFVGHHRREVLGVADLPRSLPIIVIAERDRAEVFAAWLASLELFLLLVAGLTLLVGAVAYWMGRSIVTPLNCLIAAADGIAHGDLNVQLRDTAEGEIGRLTNVFNLMTARLRRSRAEVEAANRSLHEQNRLLEKLAVTDGLTGLYNRKKLDEVLSDQFARFLRNRRPYAVLMLDLDNFKSINDTHGHAVGDEVLVVLAAILKQSVRNIDHVARYGGEEFVVVLIESAPNAALDVAERIRSVVEVPRVIAGDKLISVTVSLGVSSCRMGDDGPEQALARADQALYEAKRAGRNQVQCAL
jgi:diguanylate cyclase (GGDEF)-like protein